MLLSNDLISAFCPRIELVEIVSYDPKMQGARVLTLDGNRPAFKAIGKYDTKCRCIKTELKVTCCGRKGGITTPIKNYLVTFT